MLVAFSEAGVNIRVYEFKNCSNCTQQGGFPFSNQYDTLVFWYKYTSVAASKGAASYSVRKNGQNINGNFVERNATTTYQKMEIPISAFQEPDTLVVDFHSCRWEDSLAIQGF